MHDTIPLILAALIAAAIIIIGCFYLASPERISGTFGLKPPASDADTRAWLRPKGIRDVVAGRNVQGRPFGVGVDACSLSWGSWRSPFLRCAQFRFYEFSLVLEVMPPQKNRSASPAAR